MSKFDAWKLASPVANAEQLVDSFAQAFEALAGAKYSQFIYDLDEPKITERLCVHLQTTAARNRSVVGEWHYESMSNTLDLKDRRRTDILFTTTYNNVERVRLIFECKKVDGPGNGKRHRRHVQLYKNEGMLRYAQGSYAREESFAFTVSFSASAEDRAVEAIQRSLSGAGWPVELRMAPFEHGAHWRIPRRFATVACFETLHLRQKPFPELSLYHINLCFAKGSPPASVHSE